MKGVKRHKVGRPIVRTVALCVLTALLVAAAGCDDQLARMEENQVKVRAMLAANARQLATISSQLHATNGDLQAGMQTLGENDKNLATAVVTVQDKQALLHETLLGGNEALNDRMGQLADSERLLQDGLTQVAAVTQRTATDVTAIAREHATLHRMVQSSKNELAGDIATLAAGQQEMQTGIGGLQQADQRMTEQLAAMADGQQALHTTMQDNTAQLTGQLTSLAAGQNQVASSMSDLHERVRTVGRDVTGVATGQAALHQEMNDYSTTSADRFAVLQANQETMQSAVTQVANATNRNAAGIADLAANHTAIQESIEAGSRAVTGQVAAAIRNQQDLQTGIHNLDERADRAATALADLAAGQETTREILRSANEASTTRLAALIDDQTQLRSGIDRLSDKTDAVAAAVGTASAEQSALRETLGTNHTAVTGGLADLSESQATLHNSVAKLNEKADGMMAGIAGVAQQQTALEQTAKARNEALVAEATAIAGNQQTLHAGLDALTQKTQQLSTGVTTIADAQAALEQRTKASGESLAMQTAKLAGDQQMLQAQLDTLMATTGQTALDVIGMSNSQAILEQALQAGMHTLSRQADETGARLGEVAAMQKSMHETAKQHDAFASEQIAGALDNQRQMHGSLDTVTATAGQTALDVLALAASHDTLQQAMQSRDETMRTQMASLADSQQQIRNGLDTVTATAGQAALDVIALGDGQSRLDRAIQANRQEVAARLAEVAQYQQQWTQQFDTAQANVQTLATRLVALEQHVTNLQGTLLANLEGLTALLDANGQDRGQFEAQVNQDVQAMVDAVSQLRQTQDLLQEQMQRIQSGTQTQAESILSAIEQLRQPPAELKVSDAGKKLEPSVVDAAAQ